MDEEQQGLASPIAGGLRGIRRSVSSSVFTGRAMAPAKPDPQTTQLLTQNSLSLSNVSSQLANISGQVQRLNTSLGTIQQNLAVSDNLERQREAAKQNRERLLAEQGLREGKESEIEKKIQSALLFPVRKVAQKAQGILSRLSNFLLILAGGWLTGKTLEFIKLGQEGNKKALGEFKRKFLSQLLFAGTLLLGVKFAAAKIVALGGAIAAKALAFAVGGLFVKPFQALIGYIGNQLSNFGKTLKKGITNAIENAPKTVTENAKDVAKKVVKNNAGEIALGAGAGTTGVVAGQIKNPATGGILKRTSKIGSDFLNALGFALDPIFARQEFNEEKDKMIKEGTATKENLKKEGIKQGTGAVLSMLASLGLILIPEPTSSAAGIAMLVAALTVPTVAELGGEAIVENVIKDKNVEDGGTLIDAAKTNNTTDGTTSGDSTNVEVSGIFKSEDIITGVKKDGANIADTIGSMEDRTSVLNLGNTTTNNGTQGGVASSSKQQSVNLPIISSSDFGNQFLGVSRSFFNVGSN